MRITSKRLDNLCFVGTTEAGHSVVMEGSAAEGGVKALFERSMVLRRAEAA